MMNGLLKCSGTNTTKNIGDYIQSVAQEQFWDHIDCYVEREALNTIKSEETINVIMNGWYMWQPKNFPPSECLNPLFVSFHINPKAAEEFFSEKTISYLKKYEPIGARDRGTQALLEKHGIKSYFSACLTLTLGLNYKQEIKNNKILFVDPYIFRKESNALIAKSLLKSVFYLLRYPLKTHRLARKVDYYMTRLSNYSKRLDHLLCMATFYAVYSKIFEDEVLFNAEYRTHTINNIGVTDDEKMEMARQLIKYYGGAKLVITSRIHAALPCLAVDTPVVFIPSQGLDATRENAGRFDGLQELFNVIRWKDGKLNIESEDIKRQLKKGKLGLDLKVKNPDYYKKYCEELIVKVREFCKSTNKTNVVDNPKNTPPPR